MNTNTSKHALKPPEPKRQCFSNDYLAHCALYLIEGKPDSGAHYFFIRTLNKLRDKDVEVTPISYCELCDWLRKLLEAYENDGGE